MPLARYTLSAAGQQIHVAPTWDRGEPWVSTMRHIGKETIALCWESARLSIRMVSSDALQQRIRVALRDAWSAPTCEEASGRFTCSIAELHPDAPRLADWLADTHGETLACYALRRDDVRRKLRSTNAVERHHQEVRRRTRVIRIFPHEASLLRLLTALAIEQNDSWRSRRWLLEPTFIEQEDPVRRSA
jgi:transposase-like protein